MLTYVTENEYKTLLGVSSIPNNFTQLNYQASNYIYYKTNGRINANNIPEKVKYVTCLIINLINEKQTNEIEIGNLSSTNIEGWSETYADRQSTDVAYEKEIQALLDAWLFDVTDANGTPILYKGIPVIG